MSTKAYYPISEIGAGKTGFSKTRSIIEAAFYGNNVVKINTLKEAYDLAKNSPGTVVTDMPIYRGDEIGLERDSKVLLFNDGAVTGRYAGARRIKGEPGVDAAKLDKVVMDAVYETRWKTMYHAEVYIGLDPEFMVKAHLLIPEGEENIMYSWMLNFQYCLLYTSPLRKRICGLPAGPRISSLPMSKSRKKGAAGLTGHPRLHWPECPTAAAVFCRGW